jgi:ATP-dependent protease ClpP protease subunit
MERDRFMSPEEAVEYGLADRIIESHDLPRAALGFRSDKEPATG